VSAPRQRHGLRRRATCSRRRRLRSPRPLGLLVVLTIGIQLLLSCLRGQVICLDAAPSATGGVSATVLLALYEQEDQIDRGVHRHDDLPLHLHCPEDEFLAGWGSEPTDRPVDHALDHGAALPGSPCTVALRPSRPPRSFQWRPPPELERSLRSTRLLI